MAGCSEVAPSFLAPYIFIAAVPRSCYIRRIHLEGSGLWLTEHMTRRNLYPLLSCNLLEIERLFGEEILSSIFCNLYTKRNIKSTLIFFLALTLHSFFAAWLS